MYIDIYIYIYTYIYTHTCIQCHTMVVSTACCERRLGQAANIIHII